MRLILRKYLKIPVLFKKGRVNIAFIINYQNQIKNLNIYPGNMLPGFFYKGGNI